MLKPDLVAALTKQFLDAPIDKITRRVDSLLGAMGDAIYKRERIEIRGFGSFTVRYRAARRVHDPKRHIYMTTAAKYRPHFKPGKLLRERVNHVSDEFHKNSAS